MVILTEILDYNILIYWFQINHAMLTFPLFIPLKSPTMWFYEYGSTGYLRFGFFCWASLNKFFHFYSVLAFYFLIYLGSWIARKVLFWSFFSMALSNAWESIYFRIAFKAFKDSCKTLCQWVSAMWQIMGTSNGKV